MNHPASPVVAELLKAAEQSPRVLRAATRPLLTDCEQVNVHVFVPHYTREVGGMILCLNVGVSQDDDVEHVCFPSGLRETLDFLDYPPEAWVDGYIEGLTRIAYVRGPR